MRKNGKRVLIAGGVLLVGFAVWTWMILKMDVQPIGVNGSEIGFATMNGWFHELTGVHMGLYVLTDWLGLVPIFLGMLFGGIGFAQLLKRKGLRNVDFDIVMLGIYYVVVILAYLFFEMIPVNYRPILVKGVMEASYPSSTTLLVLCVMRSLNFQINRRIRSRELRRSLSILGEGFSVFMVIGRLISGVHWFTDIMGSVILSTGLFYIYEALILLREKEE